MKTPPFLASLSGRLQLLGATAFVLTLAVPATAQNSTPPDETDNFARYGLHYDAL